MEPDFDPERGVNADPNADVLRDPSGQSPAFRYAVTLGELVDEIEVIATKRAALDAAEARLVDEARRFVVAEAPAAMADVVGGPKWTTAFAAKRLLESELVTALRLPTRTVQSLIARSEMLVTTLPATLDALREGRITRRHMEKLVDHAVSIPVEGRAAFERAVLPAAERLSVPQFDDRARKVRERSHPESITERRRMSFADRNVTVDPARDGMAWLTAYLAAEDAIGIHNRLTDIAEHRKTGPDEERTLTQLRADTFADLLIDGTVEVPENPVGAGIRATVMVTVPVLTLLDKEATPGDLDGYGPIAPEVARELAGHAPSFIRLLTHPESGVVLSVGRDRYRPPADLQTWLRVRDGTCREPMSRVPARRSEIDHTIPWSEGGTTSADNLASLSKSWHQLKHQTTWEARQVGGGVLEWVSPTGRSYRTYPAVELPTPDQVA